MPVIHPAQAVQALLEPLHQILHQGLARLPEGPEVQLRIGQVPGVSELEIGDEPAVILSHALTGPSMFHPAEEGQPFALDRWRRAASAVLEGVVIHGLRDRLGDSVQPQDWRVRGLAILLADEACPDLQLALPDLVRASSSLAPGADPRLGVAVYAAARALGQDPLDLALRWLTSSGPSPSDWLRFGRWVTGAGLAARVGVPVEPAPSVDIPVEVGPWTWARIQVPPHPRGGQVRTEGGAIIEQPWAVAGEPLRTLAGATSSGGRLLPEVGGPVGAWDCVSARGYGQVFGVRGMSFSFYASGRVELLLADAFAGSLDAVEAAEEVGTSGQVPGRWRIAGPQTLRFEGLDTTSLSLHGRKGSTYAVPASPLGLGQILQAMQDSDWAWEEREGELYLRGDLMGGRLEIRLRRSH